MNLPSLNPGNLIYMPRKQDVSDTLYPALETGVDAAARTLYLMGGVDDEMAARALVALEGLERTEGPIRIVLSSAGGDVPAGMTVYDAICTNRHPVVIDVYGECKSMAMLILQAGSVRRASPESRLMVHQGAVGLDPVPTLALPAIAREIAYGHARYVEILAARSRRPSADVLRLCSKESYMSVTEAISVGLLDEVLPTHNPMPVKIRKVRRKR